jgi:hypothetical protein
MIVGRGWLKPMAVFFDVFGVPSWVLLLFLVTLVKGVLGPGWDDKSIAMDGGVFPGLEI